jgi:hypothetical protein
MFPVDVKTLENKQEVKNVMNYWLFVLKIQCLKQQQQHYCGQHIFNSEECCLLGCYAMWLL